MAFGTITQTEMQVAQALTMVTIAAWLAAGYLRGDTRRIRVAILALYLIGVVAFVLYLLAR